jgi:hypothetical protein
VVPTGNIVVNIGVGPLAGVDVEDDNVVILALRVPATIRVEFVVHTEEGVTSTTHREGGLGDDGLVLLPHLGLNIEGVDVAKGDASVAKSTVTTVDPEFAVVEAAAGIGTRSRSSNGGVLVVLNGFVAEGTGPGKVRNLEPPGVVKTDSGGGVTTIHEDAVTLLGGTGNVLGTGAGKLVTVTLLFLPTAFLYNRVSKWFLFFAGANYIR